MNHAIEHHASGGHRLEAILAKQSSLGGIAVQLRVHTAGPQLACLILRRTLGDSLGKDGQGFLGAVTLIHGLILPNANATL